MFSFIFFYKFLFIKTLDPDLDSLEILDPDRSVTLPLNTKLIKGDKIHEVCLNIAQQTGNVSKLQVFLCKIFQIRI
jgi:hypothetical protein